VSALLLSARAPCAQAVSYKWLARERLLPANLAKQLLFAFAEAHRGKVAATYLLAGWAADVGGGAARHVVQLVPAVQLAERSAALKPLTDVHVHSVQPTQPKACSPPLTHLLAHLQRSGQRGPCCRPLLQACPGL